MIEIEAVDGIKIEDRKKLTLRDIREDAKKLMADIDEYMADERDRQAERWLKTRPCCEYCGEPIQEEKALYLDGYWICDNCVKENRRLVE